VISDEPTRKKQDSIETDEEDAELEKELNEELKSFEVRRHYPLTLKLMVSLRSNNCISLGR